MTTRRDLLRWSGTGALSMLAGCSAPAGTAERPAEPDELLLVETAGGPAVLATASGRPVIAATPGAVAANGSFPAGTMPEGTGTRITTMRTSGGAPLTSAAVRGRLSSRAVSAEGRWVALVDSANGAAYRPVGRAATTVVVADGSGERTRLSLPGCVEPEAFSGDGGRLYVLDYLPATAPDRYRVRMIDLASGHILPLLTRDKLVISAGAEEEMRGEGRQAVFDASRARLFTLYAHGGEHRHTRDLLTARPGREGVHAFVHTLAVDEGWAYCIDLPAPFGDGPAHACAIARTSTGRLYVVDATGGAVAALDAESLTVLRVGRFQPMAGPASVASPPAGDRLYLAAGNRVTAVDSATLTTIGTWTLPEPARGIAAGAAALYIGQPGQVVVTSTTGVVRHRFEVPSLIDVLQALKRA